MPRWPPRWGRAAPGERELAAQLTGAVDEDMLITADCGFYSWQLWDLYAAVTGRRCAGGPARPWPCRWSAACPMVCPGSRRAAPSK